VEEVVEARRLEDVVGRDPQPFADRGRRVGADIPGGALDVPQDVHQSGPVPGVSVEDGPHVDRHDAITIYILRSSTSMSNGRSCGDDGI
jgi:hypothetical protein